MKEFILSASRERKLAAIKIIFSVHPQTSLCQRETSFNSREMQEDAQNLMAQLALFRALSIIRTSKILRPNFYAGLISYNTKKSAKNM